MIIILVFLVLTLVVLFYFSELFSRHYFWSLFLPLQLISYLSFYDLQQPANVQLYLTEIELATKLSIIKLEWFARIFNPEFRFKQWFITQEELATSQVQVPNLIEDNLAVLFIAILAPAYLVFAFAFTMTSKNNAVKAESHLSKIKNFMSFNGSIHLLRVLYLGLLVSVGNQLKYAVRFEEITVGLGFGIPLALFLVAVPSLLTFVINFAKRKDQFFMPNFLKKFSVMTHDLHKYRDNMGVYFHCFLFWRRFLFVLLPVIFCQHPGI